MRTTPDRIRHALSFEIIGLLLSTPLAAWVFNHGIFEIGVVGAVTSVVATAWNYLYNLMFDHAMQRRRGTTQKTPLIRVLHSVLFELGLLVMLLPFISWYLGTDLISAFVMDISYSIFYVCYAFVFNWAYDRAFPLPEWEMEAAKTKKAEA